MLHIGTDALTFLLNCDQNIFMILNSMGFMTADSCKFCAGRADGVMAHSK